MSMMNEEGEGRSLADLPPELLNLIFSKLPPVHRFKIGDELGRPKREIQSSIPEEIRKRLSKSTIVYKFRENGWLLLYYLDMKDLSGRLSCFNPSLPWPSCFIPLPKLYIVLPVGGRSSTLPPDFAVAAAFSADPTTDSGHGDLRILVFHSRCRLSVIRIRRAGPEGDLLPAEHEKYMVFGSIRGVPVAAEYTGGKFFVLFETGDILVWEIQEGGLRRMMKANPPINFSIRKMNRVRAVGESLVMTWSERSASSFRLVSVDEIQIADNQLEGDDGDRIEKLKEGVQTTTYFVREDANVQIDEDTWTLSCFCFFCLLLFMIVISIVLSVVLSRMI
ncbi:hypothetical protein LINGRAHAP2_LOCUS18908 [Linum grandiflorum]